MISEMTGFGPGEMCIFGDRLYTDIATGKKHGITAVLVLSGESTEADVAAAAPEERPDMIFSDLGAVERLMFG